MADGLLGRCHARIVHPLVCFDIIGQLGIVVASLVIRWREDFLCRCCARPTRECNLGNRESPPAGAFARLTHRLEPFNLFRIRLGPLRIGRVIRNLFEVNQLCDRLLGPEVSDVDGNADQRGDTVSVFNGPAPEVRILDSETEEMAMVAAWLSEHSKAGFAPHEFGVFVRSPAQFGRASAAVEKAGIPFRFLDERAESTGGHLSIGTMHLAKGLEFRAVAVMACDDEIIPLQERIEAVGDDADLQEVYDTERHLLYVACTRARDRLLVTSVAPASEFLQDLRER